MRIYFSHRHAVHAPGAFVSRGQVTANPEIPARADTLLGAAREARHALAEIQSFRLERGLNASEHNPLAFLRIARDGFRRIGAALGAMAIPTVLVPEGGYLSEHLGANLVAALAGFEAVR